MDPELNSTQLALLLDQRDGGRRFRLPAIVSELHRRELIDDKENPTPEGDGICDDLLHRLENNPTTLTIEEMEALNQTGRLHDDTLTRIVLDDTTPVKRRMWAFAHQSRERRHSTMLRSLAHDPDPQMRLYYCRRSEDDDATLEELCKDETDPSVLAELVGRISPSHAEKYLTHEDPRVRVAALRALPEKKQREQARLMLDDPDIRVFDAAMIIADQPLTEQQTERALNDETASVDLALYGVGMTPDTIRQLLTMRETSGIIRNRLDDYRGSYEETHERDRMFDDPETSPIARECRDKVREKNS